MKMEPPDDSGATTTTAAAGHQGVSRVAADHVGRNLEQDLEREETQKEPGPSRTDPSLAECGGNKQLCDEHDETPKPHPCRTEPSTLPPADFSLDPTAPTLDPTPPTPDPTPRRYSCDLCDYTCTVRSLLTTHRRIHTGERPFKCDLCEYTCNQRGSLTIHTRTHTGEKPYACDMCEYRCADSGSLTKHKRSHTGQKPFHCEECGRSFSVSGGLAKHRRIHTGERPYSCDLCGKRFSRIGDMSRHKRIHAGVRSYQCDQCDKCYTQSSHLSRHKLVHTRGTQTQPKSFICCICDRLFSTQKALGDHLQGHVAPGHVEGNPQNDHVVGDSLQEHVDATYGCALCGQSFSSATERDNHELQHRILQCNACGRSFPHGTLKCEECGLTDLIEQGGEGVRLHCEVCGEGFNTDPALARHTQTTHGQKQDVHPTGLFPNQAFRKERKSPEVKSLEPEVKSWHKMAAPETNDDARDVGRKELNWTRLPAVRNTWFSHWWRHGVNVKMLTLTTNFFDAKVKHWQGPNSGCQKLMVQIILHVQLTSEKLTHATNLKIENTFTCAQEEYCGQWFTRDIAIRTTWRR